MSKVHVKIGNTTVTIESMSLSCIKSLIADISLNNDPHKMVVPRFTNTVPPELPKIPPVKRTPPDLPKTLKNPEEIYGTW